jgi:hypothetical protein
MHRSVVCFAHVTNNMGQTEGDFKKGDADGTTATLAGARCDCSSLIVRWIEGMTNDWSPLGSLVMY